MPSAPESAFGWKQLTPQQSDDWHTLKSANPNSSFPPISEDVNNVWWVSIEFLDPSRVLNNWSLYTDWTTEIWEDIVVNGGGTFTQPEWPAPPDI